MRLILSLLLAGSSSYAASASTIAQSRSQPAIVQSLSTGIYRSATVIFEGHRAKVPFNRGEQIVLDLDNPVTTESEEIMGVDQNHNYWAVYVDNEAPEPGPPASFSEALAEDLLDLPRRDPKDLQALQGANAESREAFADAMPFFGGLRIRHECLPIREVHDAEQDDDAGADRHDVRHTCHPLRYPQSIVLACLGSAAATPLPQQSPAEDPTSHHSSTTEAEKPERPTSLKLLVPNILHDQKPIWTFPRKVVEGKHWKPVFGITLATVGLVVSDPYSEPYFRNSSGFNTYKMGPLRGRNTTLVITLTPVTFYLTGLAKHSRHAQSAALLAAEGIADTQILSLVMKQIDGRLHPSDIPPHGNFRDTWFKYKGTFTNPGSFPSGHAASAFAVATVIADQYRQHRWVPWLSYGAAAFVALTRVPDQAHFPSDVFVGAVLGYTISHFVVLRR